MVRPLAAVLLSAGALLAAACSTDGPVGPPLDCTEEVDGTCWTFLGLEGAWVTELAETPVGLYAGTHDSGVFRYEPDTGEWTSLGLDHAIVSSILYVPTEPARLLVGVIPFSDETTEAAVFASEDRGTSWMPWDAGLAAARGDRGWAYSLAVDPEDPRRLFMSYFNVMMRSEDGGETWDAVWNDLSLIGGGGFHTILVSPSRPDTVWAGGVTSVFTAVILRSEDGGDSWEFIDPTPRQELNVWGLLEGPGGTSLLLAGLDGGIMHSTDSGRSWNASVRAQGPVHDLTLLEDVIFATASENARLPAGSGPVVTDLGLYRSSDRGATWDALVPPQNTAGGYALEVDGSASGALLVGTRGSGVWRVAP